MKKSLLRFFAFWFGAGLGVLVFTLIRPRLAQVPNLAPTPTPAPTCPGELIAIGQKVFLANDDHGDPLYLHLGVTSANHEEYVSLYGRFEYPVGSGNFADVQPGMAVIHDRVTLGWRGVEVVIRACIKGLVYRYELLSSPNQPR